jgi:hypothetical protein
MASFAGITFAYSGDILDWTTKAGGMVTSIKGLGTAFSAMNIPLATATASMTTFIAAAAPVLAVGAALAAVVALMDLGFTAYAHSAESAGNEAQAFSKKQYELTKAMKKDPEFFAKYQKALDDVEARKGVSESMRAEMRAGIVGKFFSQAQKQGILGGGPAMETVMPPRAPTPAGRIAAIPGGGPQVRLAIQVLEESRAQTGILEQIAAALGAISMGGAAAPAGPSSMRVDIHPDSGALRLDRMLEMRARNVLGRAGYTQFGRTAFTN